MVIVGLDQYCSDYHPLDIAPLFIHHCESPLPPRKRKKAYCTWPGYFSSTLANIVFSQARHLLTPGTTVSVTSFTLLLKHSEGVKSNLFKSAERLPISFRPTGPDLLLFVKIITIISKTKSGNISWYFVYILILTL